MKTLIYSLTLFALVFATTACKSRKTTATEEPVKETELSTSVPKPACAPINRGEAMWKDPIANMLAEIKDDCLHLKVSYSGGCKEHDFALVWSGAMSKSIPPQVSLELGHNSHEDLCEAIKTQDLYFDLKELKFPGQNSVILRVQANGFSTQQLSFRY